MTAFAEVSHEEWIAAPHTVVRQQFADLHHHIRAGVHPKLRFEVLAEGPGGARFRQEVKLLGLRQRDLFERTFSSDGTMVDTSVEGFNRGGSITIRFRPEQRAGREGTAVNATVKLPLPPLVGPLLRPLLRSQIRRELLAAVAEDKRDIEQLGYPRAAAS